METTEKSSKKIILITGAVIFFFAVIIFFVLPALSLSYFNKGLTAFYKRDYDNSRKNFSLSALFNPLNPLPHAALGRLALGKENPAGENYYPEADWAKAIIHFEKSLALGLEKNETTSFFPYTLEHLGHAYLNTGQYEKAREMYLKKIDRYQDYFYGDKYRSTFWSRYLTAEIDYKKLNMPDEALNLLLPIAKSENADPANLYRVDALLARLYLYFEDFGNTEKFAKLAIEQGKNNKDSFDVQTAHGLLAQVYGKKKNFLLAETEVKIVKEFRKGDEKVGCLLSNVYWRGADYTKAIASAQTVKRSEDKSQLYSSCLYILAESYLAQGKDKEAKQYFNEYLNYANNIQKKDIFVTQRLERSAKKIKELK